MERKNTTIRVKTIIKERIKLIAKEEKKSIQKVYDEILELGLLEKYKGGIK